MVIRIRASCTRCNYKFHVQESFVQEQNVKNGHGNEATGQVYCPKCNHHQFSLLIEEIANWQDGLEIKQEGI